MSNRETLWDHDGFILSNILSFLKPNKIYSLSLINRSWNDIISKGYFYSDHTFHLDQLMREDKLKIDPDEVNRCFGRLFPCPYSYWKNGEIVLVLAKLYEDKCMNYVMDVIRHMKKMHGSIGKVTTLEMYEYCACNRGFEDELIGNLAELFPNVNLIRLCHRYECDLLTIERCVKKFGKLKQVFILDYLEGMQISNSVAYKRGMEKARTQFPTIEFVTISHKSDWPISNRAIHEKFFESDEEMKELLENHPYLMNFHSSNHNMLAIAIKKGYKNCVDYILEKRSDVLVTYSPRSPRSPLQHCMQVLNTRNGYIIFDSIMAKIVEISQKSDDYLKDVLSRPLTAACLLHPIAAHYQLYPSDVVDREYVSKFRVDDDRMLKYQSMNICDSFKPIQGQPQLPDNFKKYSGNTPLHELCHPQTDLDEFMQELEKYDRNQLVKDALTLNNDIQNIIHFITYSETYGSKEFQQLEKYQKLTERLPVIKTLLFMENNMDLTPFQLMIGCLRPHHIVYAQSNITKMVQDMIQQDRKKTVEICVKLCGWRFTLYYIISKAIGFPLPMDLKEIHSWVAYPIPTGASIGEQYRYAFENKWIDLTPDENGRTILFDMCSKFIDAYLIQCAVYYGCDVNQQDKDGNTPMHVTNRESVANLLIGLGADPNIENKEGQKAYFRWMKRGSNKTQKRVEKLVMCNVCGKIYTSDKQLERHFTARLDHYKFSDH